MNISSQNRKQRGSGYPENNRPRARPSHASIVQAGSTGPDEQWAMDFVCDALMGGRHIRILTITDLWDRSSPALEVDKLNNAQYLTTSDNIATTTSKNGQLPATWDAFFIFEVRRSVILSTTKEVVRLFEGYPIEEYCAAKIRSTSVVFFCPSSRQSGRLSTILRNNA